ncbi:protein-disulfide isomerase [Candidatus Magnetoovum chiemensis]|nr:protein-disulfide isomerase [Candidatus Magnetoovum chiemensis]
MTTKKIFVLLTFILFLYSNAFGADEVEDQFVKAFPSVKPESVKETHIEGIYEIVFGGGTRIVYYHAKSGSVIIGSIQTKEGVNITEETLNGLRKKKDDDIKAKVKDIPLDLAVKVGDGKNKVIEFTDPDCPFCRKVSNYFKQRDDVTRYVFLYPLTQIHPKAEEKAIYIFCSKDRAGALEKVLGGELDKEDLSKNDCDSASKDKVEELLQKHKSLGNDLGVNGTPLLIVGEQGEIVHGANFPLIEKVIGKAPGSTDSGAKSDKDGGKAEEKPNDKKE